MFGSDRHQQKHTHTRPLVHDWAALVCCEVCLVFVGIRNDQPVGASWSGRWPMAQFNRCILVPHLCVLWRHTCPGGGFTDKHTHTHTHVHKTKRFVMDAEQWQESGTSGMQQQDPRWRNSSLSLSLSPVNPSRNQAVNKLVTELRDEEKKSRKNIVKNPFAQVSAFPHAHPQVNFRRLPVSWGETSRLRTEPERVQIYFFHAALMTNHGLRWDHWLIQPAKEDWRRGGETRLTKRGHATEEDDAAGGK